MSVAKVNGFIKSIAETTVEKHPLQTRVELILTDFSPNRNKQGIPDTEKQNIMRSALNQPIKINFDGAMFHGHVGAIPLGPITNVYEDIVDGRTVIKGEAVIWTEYYKDISDHLKGMFEDGIGTSWEIYYADSHLDEFGVEWLHDCVFAGTCIVDTPAYGPNRTRILAIAETLNGDVSMDGENTELENAPTQPDVADNQSDDTVDTNVETVENNDSVSENDNVEASNEAKAAQEDHEELYNAQDLLFQLYEGLDSLHAALYEVERVERVNDIADIAQSFADKISGIANRIQEMRAAQSELVAEVEAFRQAEAARKAEAEKLELLSTRRTYLAEAGVVFDDDRWNERSEAIAGMAEGVFKLYADDLIAVNRKQAVAEFTAPIIPEPLGHNDDPSPQEVAAALRQHILKRGR